MRFMESAIPRFLEEMRQKYPRMARPRQGPGYVYQGTENDRLFRADYHHARGNDCKKCDAEKQIQREERYTHDPYIFYGTIASGNKVIKDPRERDLLRRSECLCVETEAAGLMNDFPCLVIRGICDYCDSHKNDKWQKYAAATAAAYAKELLNMMDVADVRTTPEARMIMAELRDLKSATNEIASDLKELNQCHQRKALYKWLTPLTSSARHGDYQKARADDTGLWLLQHGAFQDWSSGLVTEATSVLCCFGDPGVEETVLTLSSIVIDQLSRRIATAPHSGLAYMYCDYRDPEHRKAENIIGVIIKQLLERLAEIPESIMQIYKRCKQDSQAMTLQDARTICSAAFGQFSTVYICLDALDELAQEPLRDLMRCLQEVPPLSLYVTSRTHAQDVVGEYLGRKQTILVEAQEEDIRRFIIREIGGPNDVAPNAMDEKLKADIVASVVSSARGMFLLPVLQVRAILHAVTKRDREEWLISLPKDLGEAFTELAKKVITCVHLGLQIFTVKMLKVILAIREGDTEFDPRGEPDIEPLLACCHGLIVVGDTSSTVRLVHYSLQEFFIRQEELFGRTRDQWHSSLAATCLTFLFFPSSDEDETEQFFEFSDAGKDDDKAHDDREQAQGKSDCDLQSNGDKSDDGDSDSEDYEMYDYAGNTSSISDNTHDYSAYLGVVGYRIRTVFRYAAIGATTFGRVANSQTPRSSLRRDTSKPAGTRGNPVPGIYYVPEFTDNLPFQVLGYFGLTKVGAEYWDKGWNLNDYHEVGDTGLAIAARMGNEELVAQLIRKGAQLNLLNSLLQAPIHHAASNGHEKVVRLLVEAGASVDDEAADDTPLRLAANVGHVGIVKSLLASGAAIDQIRDGDTSVQTALGCAVSRGNIELTKILLEAGADLEKGLYSPPYVAAGKGNEELVRLLLSHGADPNRGSGHCKDETPFLAASCNGHERIIEILAQAGARVGTEVWSEMLYVAAHIDCATGPEHNDTALHAAAWRNHAEMVTLLLKHGASPDPIDDKGDTPLLRALRWRKMKAARVLIKNGANIERVNEYGLTPLISAALSGKVHAVELLIEEGAVVDLAAEFSRDHDEEDRDYRNYSEKDSRAIRDLARIIDSSTTWAGDVRHERRELITLLLHCRFFLNHSLATACCYRLKIFPELVRQSGTFPRGPAEIGRLRTAILQSRVIREDPETEWQWPSTVRLLLGLADAMEETQLVGSFTLGVCHELLNHKSHDSSSLEDVCEILDILSLLLGAKDILDRLWIVAKRDILYSESAGSGTGLWVVGEGDEDQTEPETADDNYPPDQPTTSDSASGEYGPDDYTSDEDESDDFELDDGGLDENATDEGVSEDKDPSENSLRWRGWNMERLPTYLEAYGSLLKIVRHQFRLHAQDSKKDSRKKWKLGRTNKLAANAAALIRFHTEYYDRLSTQTHELYSLWDDKLSWDHWR
ncbi:hypothetical protein BJX66DRAFT_343796 [Aspergillus keveii]|uniref:Nephrocystin 3-like N-terminal domain-containing protein n=1 Tax=Aspergillus keveii TaxID=714993 RepID=A0ABR4FNV0_9EURO